MSNKALTTYAVLKRVVDSYEEHQRPYTSEVLTSARIALRTIRNHDSIATELRRLVVENDKLRAAARLGLEALVDTNEEWKALADSGDAGFWKAEAQPHYQKSEQAIATLRDVLGEE